MADDLNKNYEQKISLNYETNAENTAKEVNKLDKSIDNVNKSQKDVVKTQKKVKKSQDSTTKSTKTQKKGLEDLGGGIGGAIKGFKGLIKTMWAFVANPVGAVIAAIAGALIILFKAFTSTKGGAEKFEQIMDGIGATIDVLRDRVLKIATAIGKFFSGDFKGAVEVGREAVSGFGAEVAEEFRIAAEARKSLQEVADSMRDLSVTRAKLNRDLLKAKETIESSTASYADKKDAIDKVREAETKQTELELTNARKKLKAIQDQNAQSDSSSEALQAEADAKIAVFNLEAESAKNRTKFIKLQEIADTDEATRKKGIIAANAEIEKQKEDAFQAFLKRAEIVKAKQEEADARKVKEAEQRQKDNEDLQAYLDEQEQIEIDAEDLRLENAQKAADKENTIEQAKFDQKKVIRDAELNLVSQGLGLLKSIFGKNKKIQKGILIAENALGIAKTIIKTQASNAETIAEGAALAIPTAGVSVTTAAGLVAANNISAGISIASIVAATAKGLSALGGGSAGSAPTISSPRGGSSSAPSVGFQSSSENQIATTINENKTETPVVKAIVVSKDVTTAQEADRNKVDSNSVG